MADRDYDRERRGRDVGYGRDYERDWDRGYYGRTYDYDRDWDRGYYGRSYPYRRGYTYDRDYDWTYGRYEPRYGRGFNYDWRTRYAPRYRRDYDYWDYDYEYEPTRTYTETRYGRRGPFTGIGPRGYQRSDDRIRDDVIDRLTRHGQLDASEINVDITNGIVMLSGSVNSRREKRLAEDVAEDVSGVWDVDNRLRAMHTGQQRGPMRKQTQCGEMRVGMEVVGSNGGHVGNVKEIRDNDFLVDRTMARDIFIPFNACQSIDDRLHLNVASDNIDDQGWRNPEIMETPEFGRSR